MKICSDFVTIQFYFIFYIFFVNCLAIKSCFRNIADISPYFMFLPKNSSFLVKKDMDLLKHGTQRLNYLTVFVADEILNLFFITIKLVRYCYLTNIYVVYAEWTFGRMNFCNGHLEYLHHLCWLAFWKNETSVFQFQHNRI